MKDSAEKWVEEQLKDLEVDKEDTLLKAIKDLMMRAYRQGEADAGRVESGWKPEHGLSN